MDKSIEFLIYAVEEEIEFKKRVLDEQLLSTSERAGLKEDIRLFKSAIKKVKEKFS